MADLMDFGPVRHDNRDVHMSKAGPKARLHVQKLAICAQVDQLCHASQSVKAFWSEETDQLTVVLPLFKIDLLKGRDLLQT